MKKILTISTLALLTSSFIVGEALAAVATERDTTATITAQHRQRHTSKNQELSSELHRVKEAAQRLLRKRIKKELSRISWTENKAITNVIIVGNKSINTKEIK